jgi:Tfp pilus assembly protein PilF
LSAEPGQAARTADEVRIVEIQGTVEARSAGATNWEPTRTNRVLQISDRLRTGADSRGALRWSDQSIMRIGPLTEMEILPPDRPEALAGLHLVRGTISFFHRDEPGRIRATTRGALAGVRGTEFVMAVSGPGDMRTTLSVVDGVVEFGNERSTLIVTNGQQAAVDVGQAPFRTAGFIANNLLQWCFYYPAVLDLADLPLSQVEQRLLADSLSAYRVGDLLAALNGYPAGRQPQSDAERVYLAAVLLSVGEVEKTEAVLGALSGQSTSERPGRLAAALRLLIAAVKRQTISGERTPELATELLARSYYEQSRAVRGDSLEAARELARQAVVVSPEFGFAWARLAELELGFGQTSATLKALDKGLALAPRNAQALATEGFVLASRNRTSEAIGWFDRALAVDAALGNAWLGRGLCRIRNGESQGGREDLLVAAALEPQRSELRSYLGKAYGNEGEFRQSTKELDLAKRLDPNDPTGWLYSALLNQEYNRINDAIRDLEHSKELNDNRSVYRSQLLLDQDRAVRSANLAAMYQDAGMFDVAVQEAGKAVNYDYGSYSAHLFLANAYEQLSSPNLVNRRYETPMENEFLVANLLAPPSGGTLSPVLSELVYPRLFERNRLGVVSSTEYLSRGAWAESGAQYGIFGNFSYDLEGFYRSDPGQRPNNDLEQRQLTLSVKQQIGAADSVYLRVRHYEEESGDVFQYYDPGTANPTYRTKETQEPIVDLGYHHEWGPGMHTLFLFSRLNDTLTLTNGADPVLLTFRPDVDPITMPGVTELVAVDALGVQQFLQGSLNIYSGELQQIWQTEAHNTVVGGRFQYGHIDTSNFQINPSTIGAAFPPPPEPTADQDFSSMFRRLSIYGYHQWQILDPLQLIGGVVYEHMTYPSNFRIAPISDQETTTDGFFPKAGLIWTPAKGTTARFAYTRSLAGASIDQSYRLEPSQVAGFVQSYRSIIPESVVGANAGAQFETYDLSLEQNLKSGTYLAVAGELLYSTVDRTVGAFDLFTDEIDFAVPSTNGLRQNLNYQEQSLIVTANQLLGEGLALGARYRLSKATLNSDFVDVPDGLFFFNFQPRQHAEAVLNQLSLYAIYNHPSGFFVQPEALWYSQSNSGYSPAVPGDDFWQFNFTIGYRFPRRKAEVALALLNITDQDYRLNPLNLYNELPRSRTLAVRLNLNF